MIPNQTASNTRSFNKINTNASKLVTGQENRRPLLHTTFGPKQTSNQSNSVGNTHSRTSASFLNGASSKRNQISTENAPLTSQQSKDSATRTINQLPNQTKILQSSHHTKHQSLYSVDYKINEQKSAISKQQTNAPTSAERVSATNRSISRARQFGKDLTTMFSFTRQPSRQSTQTTKPGISSNNSRQTVKPPSIIASSNASFVQSIPTSAKHADQPTILDYQQIVAKNNQVRKSSVNQILSVGGQTQLQKSLNSIEYQQVKQNASKSVPREIQIKSREKLPEIKHAKATSQAPRIDSKQKFSVSQADKQTMSDIYHVSIYCAQIEHHMQQTESQTQPDATYMRRQTEINENIRAILVDWLINVHMKFKLLSETLYISINLIDRFLSLQNVKKDEIQLVGVAALMIATKYEEIYPPTVKDFLFVTKNVFTKAQLLEMEQQILFKLQFDMSETTTYRFLERYSKIAKTDSVVFYLAQYLTELALLDSKMNQYPPSLQASAALYVAMRVVQTNTLVKQGKKDSNVSQWTHALQEHTKYTSSCLKQCAKNYFQLAELIEKSELQAIVKKFNQGKFFEVQRIISRVIKMQQQGYENQYVQESGAVSGKQTNNSCDRSTRGGSSSKQKGNAITTPSHFESSNKHITSKSSMLANPVHCETY